jgi:hypothetical protein
MEFQPVNESDIKKPFPTIAEGEYDFEILEATDTVSQNTGNDMIKLSLGIWQGEKIICRIFDYVQAGEKTEYKLRHACDSCGLLANYESGRLFGSDFKGRTGRAKVGIEPANGQYAAKNKIVDYCLRPAKPIGSGSVSQAKSGDANEESLPF